MKMTKQPMHDAVVAAAGKLLKGTTLENLTFDDATQSASDIRVTVSFDVPWNDVQREAEFMRLHRKLAETSDTKKSETIKTSLKRLELRETIKASLKHLEPRTLRRSPREKK